MDLTDSDKDVAASEPDAAIEKLWHSVVIATCVPNEVNFQGFIITDDDLIVLQELMVTGHPGTGAGKNTDKAGSEYGRRHHYHSSQTSASQRPSQV